MLRPTGPNRSTRISVQGMPWHGMKTPLFHLRGSRPAETLLLRGAAPVYVCASSRQRLLFSALRCGQGVATCVLWPGSWGLFLSKGWAVLCRLFHVSGAAPSGSLPGPPLIFPAGLIMNGKSRARSCSCNEFPCHACRVHPQY